MDYPRLNPSENRYQFAENISWNRSGHSLKAGADIMTTQDYNDLLRNRAGTYSYPTFTAFALDYTGNTTAAKRWQNYSQRFGDPIVDIRTNDYGFYMQDQYRVTANFTLNAGVRYDYTGLPQPIADGIGRVNPAYPETGRIPTTKKDFAPRLGISYSLNNSKTVLRAGYGLFYARYTGGLINTFFLENGVSQQLVTFNGNVAQDLSAGPVFPNRLALTNRTAPAGTVDLTFAAKGFSQCLHTAGQLWHRSRDHGKPRLDRLVLVEPRTAPIHRSGTSTSDRPARPSLSPSLIRAAIGPDRTPRLFICGRTASIRTGTV